MKKKTLAILFSAIMLFMFGGVSIANTIESGDSVYLTGGLGDTNGGPFVIHEVDGTTTFLSFCLERNETIQTGSSYVYTVTVDDAAVNGGLSGGNPDPLSDQTAFLYSRFLSGFISNVDALQVAIWYLEGEAGGIGNYATKWDEYWTAYGTEAQGLIDLANAAVANGWTNSGFIKVLNLYDADGVAKQSQLINVPEPLSLILLGFGLFGLGMTRKLKK